MINKFKKHTHTHTRARAHIVHIPLKKARHIQQTPLTWLVHVLLCSLFPLAPSNFPLPLCLFTYGSFLIRRFRTLVQLLERAPLFLDFSYIAL